MRIITERLEAQKSAFPLIDNSDTVFGDEAPSQKEREYVLWQYLCSDDKQPRFAPGVTVSGICV